MQISKSQLHDWLVIHIEGQVDSKTSSQLNDYLAQELDDAPNVALDLRQVPFMSSAGLRTLLLLYRRVETSGAALALVGLAAEIADTMKVTGFYDFFIILPDLDSLQTANKSS
jgi:anti-sigma B factor antagonist